MAITVDASTRYQPWQGFGSSLWAPIAFQAGWTSVADFLYSSQVTVGVGNRIYNVALTVDGSGNGWPLYSSDATSTGVEIAGDWSVEAQVAARGVKRFCLRCWCPTPDPGPYTWQVGGNINGALLPTKYAALANAFVTASQSAMLANPPVYITDWSPMNEPDFAETGQGQVAWDTPTMLTFLKNNLGPAAIAFGAANPAWRAATGLQSPNIWIGETEQSSVLVGTWIPAWEADAVALGHTTFYSTHQYGAGQVATAPPSPCSRPILYTEVYDQVVGSWDATMATALNSPANTFYEAIVTGNAQMCMHWDALDTYDTDNEGLTGNPGSQTLFDWNNPILPKRAYVFGNYALFVPPGSQRIAATGAPGSVQALAFIRPDGSVCVICNNPSGSTQAITVNLSGVPSPATMAVWVTDPSSNLVNSYTSVSVGSFSFTLSASSVTTFVGSSPKLSRWIGSV